MSIRDLSTRLGKVFDNDDSALVLGGLLLIYSYHEPLVYYFQYDDVLPPDCTQGVQFT